MKNKIEDLRNHLFETIEALKDEDNPMDVQRAKAISGVAGEIIKTAKVELDFMELTGHETGSDFMKKPELPAPGRPRLVKDN